MKIGEAHRNVRSASFKNFLFGPLVLGPHPPPLLQASVSPLVPRGGHTHLRVKGLGVPIRTTEEILLAPIGIGAPIYWRTDVPLRQ
jgi:hypothetical protein